MSILELYNKYTQASKTKRKLYAKEICNDYNELTGRQISYATFGRVLSIYRTMSQPAIVTHFIATLTNFIRDEIFPLHKCGPSEEEWLRRAKDKIHRLQKKLDEYTVTTDRPCAAIPPVVDTCNRYVDRTDACEDAWSSYKYHDGAVRDSCRDELCELFNLENGEHVSKSDFAEHVKLLFPDKDPDTHLEFFRKIDRHIQRGAFEED